MDMKFTSPNASSPKLSSVLSAVLSVGVVVWAAGAIAGTATAQTAARPVVSEAVSYADLDISTPRGATILLKRIDLAAQRICGPAPSDKLLQPEAATAHDRCVKETVDTAVARTGHPLVEAMHAGTSTFAAR